jgi:hypothetical protein
MISHYFTRRGFCLFYFPQANDKMIWTSDDLSEDSQHCRRRVSLQHGLRLCQEFVCYNRARLPSPAQWVTVNRIRVKDSYTDMEFLSDEFSEKFVPIGFI